MLNRARRHAIFHGAIAALFIGLYFAFRRLIFKMDRMTPELAKSIGTGVESE